VKGSDGMGDKILTKKKVNPVNSDVVIFTFFLFLSFGFWYINSLGKEMEADIKYPLKYINIPKEKVITGDIQQKLVLALKGPGYSVLKLKISGNKPPVLIDLSRVIYKRIPESKSPDYYIITSGLTKSISVQIRSGCEIVAVKPDTLFLTLGKTNAK
jgi:hypothetical protein